MMKKNINGRIVKGIGGLYTVAADEGFIECSVRGIFRKENIVPLVGDYVELEILDEKMLKGNINVIKDRKNQLIRPKVSNVDHAVIVFALKSPEIYIDLLDRFIILAEEQNLPVTLCINKIDLCRAYEYENIKNDYEEIGYKVVCASADEKIGITEFTGHLADKVSVLAGPSGVGKTSLINAVSPILSLKTGELSLKIERGKHTTRHAELIRLFHNTYIVDSPGFSSITLSHIKKKDLPYLFREFRPFLESCRFANCSHVKETGCMVKENIGKSISESRYERYVKFFIELGVN